MPSDGREANTDRCECDRIEGKCMYCKRREAGVPDPGVMFPW